MHFKCFPHHLCRMLRPSCWHPGSPQVHTHLEEGLGLDGGVHGAGLKLLQVGIHNAQALLHCTAHNRGARLTMGCQASDLDYCQVTNCSQTGAMPAMAVSPARQASSGSRHAPGSSP